MSWKPEIQTAVNEWNTNSQTFATKEEAEVMAKDVFNRWMLATDHRAVESDEPVNYRLTKNSDGVYQLLSVAQELAA